MNLNQIQLFLIIYLFSSFVAFAQEKEVKNDKYSFFEESYGPPYQATLSSGAKTQRLELAQKILSDSKAVKNKSFKIYMLIKATKLTENFAEAQAIALQIYSEIFENNDEKLLLKYLPFAIDAAEQYYKYIPTMQTEKRAEVYEKKLNYEILYAKLLFNNNFYKDSAEILKRSIFTAKTLKLDKTIEMITETNKTILPLLQIERNLDSSLEKIKNTQDTQNNINLAGEIIAKDYGNISAAIPFLLKSSNKTYYNLGLFYRKYLALNKKAGPPPLYLTEADMDLQIENLLALLEIDSTLASKVAEIRPAILTGNNKAILEMIEVGETIVDKGSIVSFTEYFQLANTIRELAEKTNNVNAKFSLNLLASQVLSRAEKSNTKLNETLIAQINILDKNIKENLAELTKDKRLINFDLIPTSLPKLEYLELSNKRFLAKMNLLANIDTFNGKDVSNPLKLDLNTAVFMQATNPEKIAKGFTPNSTWDTTYVNNYGFFSLPREKNKVSILYSYMTSQQNQKVICNLSCFGKTFVYIDGKPIKFTEKDNKLSTEIIFYANKEIQIRVIIFNGDSGELFGNLSLSFYSLKEEPDTNLQSFINK